MLRHLHCACENHIFIYTPLCTMSNENNVLSNCYGHNYLLAPSKYDILTKEPRMLTVETLHHKYELNSFNYCHIQLTVKVIACGAMCRGQI